MDISEGFLGVSWTGSSDIRSEWPPLPFRSEGDVLVMFSGGADSSLTASLLSEDHPVVHLVTYTHRAMSLPARCTASYEFLRKAHGYEKFVHHIRDIDDLTSLLFFWALPAGVQEHGAYALSFPGDSHRLAMHVASILYCQEHAIRYAADGSNLDVSKLFSEQTPRVLDMYRRLYARYGIEYSNPVFAVERSHDLLFERGVTPKRDYKTENVVFFNQHISPAGVMFDEFAFDAAFPWPEKDTVAERSIAARIRTFCIPFLDKALRSLES
jgi:hypothetical protein